MVWVRLPVSVPQRGAQSDVPSSSCESLLTNLSDAAQAVAVAVGFSQRAFCKSARHRFALYMRATISLATWPCTRGKMYVTYSMYAFQMGTER